MIAVIDYEAGNLKSVETSLRFIGIQHFVTKDPAKARTADSIIFPGVGEARSAMDTLKSRGIDILLKEQHAQGKPILGICIGCQLVLSFSEERDTECLDLIKGRVRRFPGDAGLKVPHMGWNSVNIREKHHLFEGVPEGSNFYFVHSYYPSPDDTSCVLSSTNYGIEFTSGMINGSLAAVQFHPEKSGPVGLRLLQNFCTWNP